MRAIPILVATLVWSVAAAADPPSPATPTAPDPPGAPRRSLNPRLGHAFQVPVRGAASSPAPAAPPPPAPAPQRGSDAPIAPSNRGTPVAPAAVVAPTPIAPRPHRKPRPHKPEPPALPPAAIKLTLDAPSPLGPWTLRVENTGPIPVQIAADARLLSLEVTLPEAKHGARPIACELPDDMRPSDDDDRSLVLPPGRTFAQTIDPRLFCFGERNAAALVPGASVVPRLVGSRELPVVWPLDEVEPRIATEHEWTGVASTVGPAVTVSAKVLPPRAIALSTPAFADVDRAAEAALPITVKNEGSAPVVFLFRPETVALDVTGPTGVGVTDPSPTVHCAWTAPPPPPIRDLFTRLSPSARGTLSVLPDVLCPDGTFDRPGLYVVRARLDTRKASGAPIDLHTFDGEAAADATTRLRVREATGKPVAERRPQLDVAAAR